MMTGRARPAIPPPSFVLVTLASFFLGAALGVLASGSSLPHWRAVATFLDPVGTLWVNALRMAVIPLVVTLVVSSVGGAASSTQLGRLGMWMVGSSVALLAGSAIYVLALAPPLLRGIDLPAVPSGMSVNALPAVTGQASFVTELSKLVPINPFEAATRGDMLQLLVFALAFGLAVGRLPSDARDSILRLSSAVSDALLTIIRWVTYAAPVGAFALVFVMTARTGTSLLSGLGYYVGVVSLLTVGYTVVLFILATTVGKMPLSIFARGMAPALTVAFSTRSSKAALPALILGAERGLRLPPEVIGFTLPLASATLRLSMPISNTIKLLFLVALYDMSLGTAQLLAFVASMMFLSIKGQGIPSGGFTSMPLFLAMGIPMEGIALLYAVDPIPDLFKTALNVTGHMTSTVLVARGVRVPTVQDAATPIQPHGLASDRSFS